MLWPVVKALFGHYRRYPLQMLLVLLGLTLGVSLLVGVTSINHHARQSYADGEKLFSNPLPYRIRPKHISNTVPQGLYIQLRRDGFNECVPFVQQNLTTDDGDELVLVGLDPISMFQTEQGMSLAQLKSLDLMDPPYPIVVSQGLAERHDWKDGDSITLDDQSLLGPIVVDKNKSLSGTRMIADISLLRMLNRSSGIGLIACEEMPKDKLAKLKSSLPNGLSLSRSSHSELESLTNAFHMNLSALGMLSFVVGLFIFYQAISLSFVQRQPLVGILRQTGVSGWQLAQALSIELIGMILISWLCGNVFGLMLANQLIPAVATSLGELYNANVGIDIGWSYYSSFYSLGMCVLGVITACIWPLVRLLRSQPNRLTSRLSLVRFAGTEFTLQAFLACALCVAGVAIYQVPQTQTSGFAIIALMMMSVALFTPFLIWKVFTSFTYSLRWVKLRWFFADAATSMSYRGVATMGLMLAMAGNIGVETMVGSFRDTTDKWLTQRLAADLYIYPSNSSSPRVSHWLQKQPEVESVWWRWEKDEPTARGVLQIVSTGASDAELDALTVKLGIPNYWYHLHHSKGVMISESMSLKLGIRPGDFISLSNQLGQRWQVVGVYYDYGNPYNQALLSHRNWLNEYAGTGDVALGVELKPGVNPTGLKHRLASVFRLNSDRVFDNSDIHTQAMKVFDRTFAIADSLGHITLFIAVCGIFFATLAGEVSRQRHIALLRCFGISGKELVIISGLQLLVFCMISVVIAMPLGLALASLVVDVVIKQSFGWTLELRFVPMEYVKTIFWVIASLMVAGALPVWRTIKSTPMKSLRDSL
ncbi:ABC transporter permease [Vibrio genomosp. F10]|uniref:ABC transporter permease n=1 Tax=Vibrio genomosp. F10 TaxID=723171 RepID=UPI00030D3F53|nr:ABC transporter permease [Vibrio genomosp. F10]OEF07627.1 ABC transporter permease [Vibrio genomosp. F10 str. 9ZB36]